MVTTVGNKLDEILWAIAKDGGYWPVFAGHTDRYLCLPASSIVSQEFA